MPAARARDRRWRGTAAVLLAAASLAVALLGGCTREAAAPAAPAATPKLLLALAQEGATRWQLLDPADGRATPLGDADPAGELLAVDDAGGEFLYRGGRRLLRDSWRDAGRVATEVSPLPPLAGRLHALWIDRDSGAPMAIELREPTADEAAAMRPDPPDARPVWAVPWRWHEGRWHEGERRASAWGAEGAAAGAVLDDLRHERGRSRRTIDDAASCAGRLCDDEPEAALTAGLASPDAAPEGWRRLPAAGGQLLFGVGYGDSWHAVAPLRFLAPGAPARELAVDAGEGLRLLLQDRWLVVAPESPPGPAWLFDLPSGRRWPLGTVATTPVWVR